MEMKKYIIYILLGLLLLISLIFDAEILNLVIQNRIALLSPIMIWMEYAGHQFIISVIITLLFLYKRKYSGLIALWTTLITTVISTYLLKYIIQRPRPLVDALIQKSGYSFPSGHTAVAFSVLPLLEREYPRLKYIWFFIAFLIAFSRLYLGVHLPSEIIAGAIIGYFFGNLILYIGTLYQKSHEK